MVDKDDPVETRPAPTVTGEDWPSDGSCVRCGAIPRRPANGLCATCEDEETVSSPNATQAEAVVTEAPLTFEGWLDEIENWSLRWERVCEELEIDTLRNGSRLRIWLKTAWDLGATAALRQHQSEAEALREAFMRLCEALGIPATACAWLEADRIIARTTKAEAENERLREALDEVSRRISLLTQQNTGRWNMKNEHDRRTVDVLLGIQGFLRQKAVG